MRQRRWFAFFLLVALAAGAGYFFDRSAQRPAQAVAAAPAAAEAEAVPAPERKSVHTTTAAPAPTQKPRTEPAPATKLPLPPKGAPLAQVFEDLKARADGGDAEAASRLFHDLERCRTVQSMARYMPRWVTHVLDHGQKAETPQQVAQEDEFLAHAQRSLDFVRSNEAMCAGVEASQLNAIIPVMLEAAQGGDRRALDCYVGADFMSMPGLLEHPEWLTQYKQNAMALAQTAYQQGDWVVVGLLEHAYGGMVESSLLGQLLGPDPAQAYAYLKLQRLGANGDFIAKLDEQLTTAAQGLSTEQIATADNWAHVQYAKYFNATSSNELSNGVNICGSLED